MAHANIEPEDDPHLTQCKMCGRNMPQCVKVMDEGVQMWVCIMCFEEEFTDY